MGEILYSLTIGALLVISGIMMLIVLGHEERQVIKEREGKK